MLSLADDAVLARVTDREVIRLLYHVGSLARRVVLGPLSPRDLAVLAATGRELERWGADYEMADHHRERVQTRLALLEG